ncbi:hypothetical protein ASH00_14715 [Arthrobacter sp. Soil782]|uniref:hypothetical protein n=1 Tax=Arthrobacter sp. Soil782 TaxID=1736410 RepID=UPI0007005A53|nr:hypothetical protein [Arthrobacter sp. Soil782]KRF04353.1 hypothetical protein ASH00_14715 [Arthrobacter sp. Soil782]
MDVHQVARELNSALGPTLVAALSGVGDRELPTRWAQSDGPEPAPECAQRLRFAHEQWTRFAAGESEDAARNWFICGNPRLDEGTPLTAIRENRWQDVSAAVTSYLEGGWNG